MRPKPWNKRMKKKQVPPQGSAYMHRGSKAFRLVNPDCRHPVTVLADAFSGAPETCIVVGQRSAKTAHGGIARKGRDLSRQVARVLVARAERDDIQR